MLKKFSYFVIILLSLFLGCWLLLENVINHDENITNPIIISKETPLLPNPEITENSEALLQDIINQAKKGQILETPFKAGQSLFQELEETWGQPENSTPTSQGIYGNYLSTHHVTVGHNEKGIFDLRSYHPDLNAIQLNDVINRMGKPDEIRYYVDDTANQEILVYQINPSYQLKWILDKATDNNPNPKVHHISVLYNGKKQVQISMTVTEIIDEMTLKEKVGQLIMAGISDTAVTQNTLSLINQYHVGGIIFYAENIVDSRQTLLLLNQLKTVNAQNTMPLFLGIDQEGGRISRLPRDIHILPSNEEIGKINDPHFSFNIGELLGKELNSFGFNMNFAPVMDVNSNPDNSIIGNRSFGNDPELVAQLGIQTMKGIQSQQVISVIKHFPGHGDTSVDSHLKLPIVQKSLHELNGLELIPFKKAITDGADVVMIAHILLPQLDEKVPSFMSKPIITDLLRNQLGFDGVVVTDDMTMKAISDNYDIALSSIEAIKAGSDLILVAHDQSKIVSVAKAIEKSVLSGEISEERLDESVSRVVKLKKKYALTNTPIERISTYALNEEIEQVLVDINK